jgi:hypothetical protein
MVTQESVPAETAPATASSEDGQRDRGLCDRMDRVGSDTALAQIVQMVSDAQRAGPD